MILECDERHPGCRNCARLGKICPGYRPPDYGRFRIQTSENNYRKQKRQDLGLLKSADSVFLRLERYEVRKECHQHCHDLIDLPRGTPQVMPSHIPTKVSDTHHELIEQAVWVALNQLDSSSRVFYNIRAFDFLPAVLSAAGPESHVYAAMRSMAAVNLANRSSGADLRRIVGLEHNRAMTKVGAALADPDQYLRDNTLIAVWLLSKRELFLGIQELNGVVGNTSSSYRTHFDGLLTLLRLRGNSQFHNEESRRLYGFFLAPLNWTPLFAGEEPTQEYLALEAEIPLSTMPTAVSRLYRYYHGVCRLQARAKEFLMNGSHRDDLQAIGGFFQAACNLDESMRDWCDVRSWMPEQFIPAEGGLPTIGTTWTSRSPYRLWYFRCWAGFFHWNKYLVARILLHGCLLEILTRVEHFKALPNSIISWVDGPGTRARHNHLFHKALQDYIGMFAYAFGDIDDNGLSRCELTPAMCDGSLRARRGINVLGSLQIQPPMSFLITSHYIDEEERQAVGAALQRFRAEFQLW